MTTRKELAVVIRQRFPDGQAPWGTNKALAHEFHLSQTTVSKALRDSRVTIKGNILHGRILYTSGRCRCDVCRHDNNAYQREYRALRKRRAS